MVTSALTLPGRCAMFQSRMPPLAFFSHDTAALLHGLPLPWQRSASPVVHIAMPSPHRAPHAAGVVGHKLVIGEHETREYRGLRITNPVRTWLDLGSRLTLPNLVAVGDAAIARNAPLCRLEDLARGLRDFTGRRGLVNLHWALSLLSDRSESPPESVLRVVIALAGLPEPLVNYDVTDRYGEFVARTDLRIVEYKLVLEYMGDYHRTSKGQWRADMTRRSRLEAQGWRVVELNADDLKDHGELIARIRMHAAVQQRSLGLPS